MSFWGKTIYTDYYFGAFDPKHIWNWGDKTVGKGTEIDFGETNGIYSVDFAGKEIAFKFQDIGLFSNYSRNGPVFTDYYDQLPPIKGFTLKTNMQGLTKSDIKFTNETLTVDWRGTSFTKSTYVLIKVEFGYKNISGTDNADRGINALKGTKYDDFIFGRKGADELIGGKGADTFLFSTGDTGKTKATADLIKDFKPAEFDLIDLSRYDGNSKLVGTQDFKFIGTKKFSKAIGELRYEKVGAETHITGDTDGDGKLDLMIRLSGKIDLTADHFIF
jgi:Ca2+-binding RTX toxin-like protein